MARKHTILNRRRLVGSIAAGVAALVLAGGAYGVVGATSGSGSSTASAATTAQVGAGAAAGHFGSGGGGSNARSGPAAGGTSGKVTSVSTSGFTLKTAAGQKVTVKETSTTAYEKGTKSASASAVTTRQPVLVLGTVNSTTITASQVIVQPKSSGSAPSWAGKVVPFKPGTQSASKTAGQIPASYKQGSGTLVSGTAANKATKAALAIYPGGIVDRVVRLRNGEYEVHNIGVNWPHHIFVNQNFQMVGAD
jgi:hypothetical protein